MNDRELVENAMAQIRAAIAEEKKRGDMHPNEFTTAMYAESGNISTSAARRELEMAVAIGIAQKRKSATSGNTNYYSWAGKEE